MSERSWEEYWLGLLFSAVVVVICLTGYALTADHTIRYYYVVWQKEAVAPIPCIYSYREWWPDDVVYCNSDTGQLTAMLDKLSQSLKAIRH